MKKISFTDILMGIQYLFVAAGATILVPILTGIPASIAFFTAGVGTLLFHFITKKQIPILLSSSFAFIAPIVAVNNLYGYQYSLGGIFFAGLVYVLLAGIVYLIGIKRLLTLFPPVITSTMVILIGLILSPIAINNASTNWILAIITFGIGIVIKTKYEKNIFGAFSIIIAILIGSLIAIPSGFLNDITKTSIISLPAFTLPKFSLSAILIIAPVAIVTFLEHFADVSAVSKVVEKDFLKDPGIHRTLLGDGLATSLAGLLGGIPNTTYSENIGALEMTGVKKPIVLRITACLLILLSFFPFLTNLLFSIPQAVIGGISILLFGMISASGIKSLVSEKVDTNDFKNLIIISSMLVIGVGGAIIDIGNIQMSSLALSALFGVMLNFLLNYKQIINEWF